MLFLRPLPACSQEHRNDRFDDVLQMVPVTAALALKACGVESRNDWKQFCVSAAMSYVIAAGVTYPLKLSVRGQRPDHTDHRSFPSGHSMVAFTGATVLHKEFGKVSPWISVAGYAVATATAVSRVVRDRHYWYDAMAGAAIGYGATELGYYLSGKLFRKKNAALAFTGTGVDFRMTF